VLRPGAELRFATDDKSYLPYALERLAAHSAFEWTARGPGDWKVRPEGWPPTRYEAKAIKGPPSYLGWRRRTPDPARSDPGSPDRTTNS
jgi:tRNA (guanine-N7-)-methyltransferase